MSRDKIAVVDEKGEHGNGILLNKYFTVSREFHVYLYTSTFFSEEMIINVYIFDCQTYYIIQSKINLYNYQKNCVTYEEEFAVLSRD